MPPIERRWKRRRRRAPPRVNRRRHGSPVARVGWFAHGRAGGRIAASTASGADLVHAQRHKLTLIELAGRRARRRLASGRLSPASKLSTDRARDHRAVGRHGFVVPHRVAGFLVPRPERFLSALMLHQAYRRTGTARTSVSAKVYARVRARNSK